MIDDLKPYPEYKDSGLPWLGQVPAHWQVRRVKTVLREIDRRSEAGREPLLSLRLHGGLVDHHALGGKAIPPSALVGYKHIKPGEIVMNRMRAALGLFAAAKTEGLVSPDYAIFHPVADVNLDYAVQLFRTPAMASVFRLESRGLGTGESGFLRLYSDRFGTIPIPLPPPDEQAAIVRFLSWATGQVDRAILAKRKVIALLNEQKQAIVHRAITRGLHTHAPKASTKLPWLSSAPSTWEVRRLKSFCEFVTSGSRGWARYYADAGPLFLRISNISTTSIDLRLQRKTFVMPPADAEGARTRVLPDDILLSITAQIGAVGLVPSGLGEAYVNQHTALIRLRGGSILPRWVAYSLLSEFGKAQCRLATNGGTKVGLTLDDVRCLSLLVPEMEEQQAIVNAIDSQTQELDAAIAAQTRTVERLRDYRERLIADAVTGQVDVCAVSSSLPAIVEVIAAQPDASEIFDADEEEAAA